MDAPAPPPAGRPFRRLDAALLLAAALGGAALAAPLGAFRADAFLWVLEFGELESHHTRLPLGLKRLWPIPYRAAEAGQALLATLSLGLALSTFARVGRRWRSGPGHAATAIAAALVALAATGRVAAALQAPQAGKRLGLTPTMSWPDLLVVDLWPIPWAVGLGWLVLRAIGAWRRPVDWADRAGRWLGAAWLATLGLRIAAEFLARG